MFTFLSISARKGTGVGMFYVVAQYVPALEMFAAVGVAKVKAH